MSDDAVTYGCSEHRHPLLSCWMCRYYAERTARLQAEAQRDAAVRALERIAALDVGVYTLADASEIARLAIELDVGHAASGGVSPGPTSTR